MRMLLVAGSVVLLSLGALAHDTSGGSKQCSGVIPGAKPHYLMSEEGDRITVRSTYNEISAIGSNSRSTVSSQITVLVIPNRSTSRVTAVLQNNWSAQDCKEGYSGLRTYQVQLKPCYMGNTVAFEGAIGGENRVKPVQDVFPADGRDTLALSYVGYCPKKIVFGGSEQKLMIELNGRPATNPVGEKGAFGLKL